MSKITPFLKYVLIILFLSLWATIANLGITREFIGEDSGFIYSYPDRLHDLVYFMWDSLHGPGKMNVTATFGFVWSNFILSLLRIGITDLVIKRLTYFLFFITSGISMMFLSYVLFYLYGESKQKKLFLFGAFFSALFYMFNHFTMAIATIPIINYHLTYMFLPLLFGLLLYNLHIRTSYLSTVAFILTAFVITGGNPSNTILIIIFIIAYLIFFAHRIFTHPFKPVIFLCISTALLLALTSYIYLPMLVSGSNPYQFTGFADNFIDSLRFNSYQTTITNIIRLAGSITWSNYPYYNLYTQNGLFIILSYLIPLAAFVALLVPGKKNIRLFLFGTIIVSLFFAKGVNPPGGMIMIKLMEKFPFLGMFRAVYPKFIYFAVLAYSFLIAQTIVWLLFYAEKIKKNSLLIMSTAIVVLLIFNMPFFLSGNLVQKDFFLELPKEYKNLSVTNPRGLSGRKILSLPPSPRGAGLILNWGARNDFAGPHPDAIFLGEPTIDGFWFYEREFDKKLSISDSWTGVRFEKQLPKVLQYAPFLNIDRVLLHKDVPNSYDFGMGGVAKIDGTLKYETSHKELEKARATVIKKNPYFNLYEVAKPEPFGLFYIPEKLIITEDQTSTLSNLARKKGAIDVKTAVIDDQITLNEENFALDTKNTSVSFTRVNSSNYNLVISNAPKKPYLLVFSESYHPAWALINSQTEKKISEEKHIKVNSYANAWIIDPLSGERNYSFAVKFTPQDYFDRGVVIMKTVLLTLLLGYLINIYWRMKKSHSILK